MLGYCNKVTITRSISENFFFNFFGSCEEEVTAAADAENELLSMIRNLKTKWKVTKLIRGGSNFSLFVAFYCSCLGLNALLALPKKQGCN